MIAIVDYGMGNLRSVQSALERVGASSQISSDPALVASARLVVIPGVGSFRKAMENLRSRRLDAAIGAAAESGAHVLGICLGMQLLAERGDEDGPSDGLGLIPGRVVRIQPDDPELRVPHMGWNEIRIAAARAVLDGIPDGAHFYFVHSYHFRCADQADVIATVRHGDELASVVQRGRVIGTQFHPERSQGNGLHLLRNVVELVAC